MQKKLTARFYSALVIFGLMGQIAWVVENMYFNVFIYRMFHASTADISVMVTTSAVTAALTTLLMGTLSDRIAKRKIFIVSGYVLWGISVCSFAFLREDILTKVPSTVPAAVLGISFTIALDCLMTFFGSTANDAAFNAWLTDATDESNRGKAEGINAMMPLLAILVVFGSFMFLDLNAQNSWTILFFVIGCSVMLVGIIGIFIIHEEPISLTTSDSYLQSLVYSFKPSTIRRNPLLYIVACGFILFNISIQIFMPYLIIYYEVTLSMSNYVLVMAPAIIIASAVTFVWGRYYDKKGFVASLVPALIMLALGYGLLYSFKSTVPVFIGSLFMMSGYLAGMAVFGAMIRSLTPCGMAGRFQGVRIFSQVLIPGIIGPSIGRFVLRNAKTIVNGDGTESFIPSPVIFLAACAVLICIIPLLIFIRDKTKRQLTPLTTPYEESDSVVQPPFSDYPRPQFRRNSYLCLNGPWSYSVYKNKTCVFQDTITVPFPAESRISGINRPLDQKETAVYLRSFSLPDGFIQDRVVLHFGAVDQYATIYINDKCLGNHEGGYLPFSFDITDILLPGENTIRCEVRDPLDPDLPYGKQRKKRGGMWYTPISGIWQTVWIESIPVQAISSIRFTPKDDCILIQTTGGCAHKELTVATDNGPVIYTFDGDSYELRMNVPRYWTPDDPYLYHCVLTSGSDTVHTYFAWRTIGTASIGNKMCLTLNGTPYFFHGVLDQGYYSDGIYLPASPQGYVDDILRMKSCGFNMLRKHIKLEPDLFYYYCDLYGMVVFQDMINSGRYSFMLDTALPTVFMKRGYTHTATTRRRRHFLDTSCGIINLLYNHPSVCYYTIFNEGWGQFSAADCYRVLREKDRTRIYDTTSGWFKTDATDVESDHVYFKPIKMNPNTGRPMVLSEFGGYSCRIPEHISNTHDNYGYRDCSSPDILETELFKLYTNEVIPQIRNGLCASVLTQLSDVEDETNGLITYDRRIVKVSFDEMAKISTSLFDTFHNTHHTNM